MNGPFSIVIAHHGEMIGLTDRIKLRPMVAGTNGDYLYLSSEEAAMRLVSPELDRFWCPRGGEPVVARLNNNSKRALKSSLRRNIMKTYVIPEYLVERDEKRCIRCKVCVNQCTYDTHFYDQETDTVVAKMRTVLTASDA